MVTLLPFDEKQGSAEQSAIERVLSGTVTSVVFTSDDGQYMVVQAEDRSGRAFTMLGPLSGLAAGEEFEAQGRWEQHKDYGRRFKVIHFKSILPSTTGGIQRYLASGVIPGIGDKLAGRIVAKFGKDTLTILDKYSTRLREVEGIGKKRVREIKEAWEAQAALRERDVYLQSLGISSAFCRRINRHFGDDTVSVLRKNPYRSTEVHGIGFRMADAIARRLGIEPEHLFRLAAGVVYVLSEFASSDGHCCVLEDELLAKAAQTLEVDRAKVESGVSEAIRAKQLVRDGDMLYLAPLFYAERELSGIVRSLTRSRADELPAVMPVSESWRILNHEQRQAVRQAFRSGVSIITGGPGVGKTTVTREVVHVAQALDLKVALAAPTGRAAKRLAESCGMPAKTIHRLLKWEPENGGFYYGMDQKLPVDLLIVDEVSMIDLQLALSLFRSLDGMTRVILVGDRDQLPSVGPGNVLADLIASGRVPVQHLSQVYRQAAGSDIIASAHRVNRGQLPDLTAGDDEADEDLRDFYWIEQDDSERVLAIVQRLVQDRIPSRFKIRTGDIQVLTPMNRGICGASNLNAAIKQLLNPVLPDTPVVHFDGTPVSCGDRVMQIVNNYELRVFNGDLGRVVQIDHTAQQLTVAFDSGPAHYPFSDLDQLRLAYAITIHKSQGCEFPAVIVPLLTSHYVMLKRNLVYTAMTRASRLLVMVGSKKALAMAINNHHQAPRYSRLEIRLKG